MRITDMQTSRRCSAWLIVGFCLAAALFVALPLQAAPRPAPLQVSLIDQLPPQGNATAFQGLDERRRGPLFRAALDEVSAEGKLPAVQIINGNLDLPATVADEPPVPPDVRLLRVYLTAWSRTRLGGNADTEVFCRFFVELRRNGHVEKKLGPFFARRSFDATSFVTPQDRWAQFQTVAKAAIEKMAAALRPAR